MQIHVIPDTAIVTKEHMDGGKVGAGVKVQNKLEDSPTELKEVQPDTKIIDETSVARDLGVSLQFAVDKETGVHLIQVLDPETRELIHQYPPEEFLQVVKHLRNLKGMLFSARL